MKRFDGNFACEYIIDDTLASRAAEADNAPSFLYDYNEVQELYGVESDNDVYIVGATNLRKAEMLSLMVKGLLESGIDKRNIVYMDFTMPFVRGMGIQKAVSHFSKTAQKSNPFFAVINEICLCSNWVTEVRAIKKAFPQVRFLCSSSIAFEVHEHFYDNPDERSKIIVLSEKNDSNIKHEQDRFGVFDEFKYNIKNGICEIKGLTKAGKKRSRHIVPETIDGYPVKVIASGAFHHRAEMTEITLPDSIEFIGDYAFTYCKNLASITPPKNLRHIGDCSFLGASALKTINGGGNIEHIGNSAFYGTAWLVSNANEFVTLGKVLYRYSGQSQSVRLCAGIKSIASFAFANSNIESIDLAGIVKIGEGCFYNCWGLKTVANFALTETTAFLFYDCTSFQVIDSGFVAVGEYSFFNCKTIKSLRIKDATIHAGAFEDSGLERLDGSVAIADDTAFYNSKLRSADLRQCKSIGNFAFSNTQLEELLLIEARQIGTHAFSQIDTLKAVHITNQPKVDKGIFFGSNNIEQAELFGKYPLSHYWGGQPSVKVLSVNHACCDNFARNNSILEQVSLFDCRIGNWAFYGNKALSKVKFQKTYSVGAWAFAYCDAIKEILIPSSTDSLEMNAFRYCNRLTRIEIQGERCLQFGANAFYSTSESKQFFVTDIEQYRGNALWSEYANCLHESDFSTHDTQEPS
jgi:hypothetical protein